MAIGFGAMVCSWVNDSGFWVVANSEASPKRKRQDLDGGSDGEQLGGIGGVFGILETGAVDLTVVPRSTSWTLRH